VTDTVGPAEERTRARLSLVAPLNIVLRRRRLFWRIAMLSTALGVLLGWLTRRYAADAQFMPNMTSLSASSLAGIAAQFGIGAGSLGDADESVDFYASLVRSREVLTAAVKTVYRFPSDFQAKDTIVGDLVTLFHARGDTEVERIQDAVKKLDRYMRVDADEQSGLIALRVRARWPGLAEQVNARLLALVNEFNVSRRETRGGIERHFVEARLAEALQELTAAEDDMRRFLEANRTYQDSPRLAFEAARLQRRVDLRQQVYSTLAQSYEQARLDEVRNTPVVTIVDHPEGSAQPTRSWTLIIIGAVLLGIVMGTGAVFFAELLVRQRVENPEDLLELDRYRTAAVEGLRHLPAVRHLLQRKVNNS